MLISFTLSKLQHMYSYGQKYKDTSKCQHTPVVNVFMLFCGGNKPQYLRVTFNCLPLN